MNLNIHPKENRPIRILWFGDMVVLSGFGRIGNEVTRRLHQRGYALQGAGISYSGWPHDFPFHQWPLAGQDIWGALVTIVNGTKPDILISCQDFPYHVNIWQACRIDFSKTKWIWITPIDGTPIHPDWLDLCKWPDGKMTISRFGVEAFRQAGQKVSLCHPGVEVKEFYPADSDERAALREKAGYNPADYIVGIVAMNQGRKAIPPMVQAFYEFARDKPNAKLYLDMDKAGPGGWDIPNLLKQMGLSEDDRKRVRYKEDVFASSQELTPLRNRYVLLDSHMVISHREGFGLPLLESMACKVATIAMDWCSGTEIVGDGRGILIPRLDYMEYGTWGGARDAFPDLQALERELNMLYCYPERAAGIASVGYEWAIQQTWDRAADAVEAEIHTAFAHERNVSREPAANLGNPVTTGLSDNRSPANDERDRTVLQPITRSDSVPEKPVPDSV
jgi:glycosyltransferase involved in cell wall biosynthesis